MPPPWATEVTLDQSLPPLLPDPPDPPDPLEHPAASIEPAIAAAATASVFLFRTVPLRAHDHSGQDGAIVAVACE